MAGDLVVDLAIHLPGTTEGPQAEQKDPQACQVWHHVLEGYTSHVLTVNLSRGSSAALLVRPAVAGLSNPVSPAHGYFHVTSIPKKCRKTSRFGLFFGFC
jgi:hypothetical protein